MSPMEIELTAREISSRSLAASLADSPGLHRMLSIKEVRERVPLSTRQIDRLIKQGDFPAPIFISPNRRAFIAHHVEKWQREKETLAQHKRNYSTKKKAA